MRRQPAPALAPAEAGALERVVDPRIGRTPDELEAGVRERLDALGLLADPARAAAAVERAACERPLRWADRLLTQGELLAAFARHCADDLEDVVVEESSPTLLVARRRSEIGRIELRAGVADADRLVSAVPTLLVGDLGDDPAELVERFLSSADLRSRLAVLDPDRLEKIAAVRSSLFVYCEWFLRDAYGVKVLPSAAFTRGLVDRGIISLGMG